MLHFKQYIYRGCFLMGKNLYTSEIKWAVVREKLEGKLAAKESMDKYQIKNKSQVETWIGVGIKRVKQYVDVMCILLRSVTYFTLFIPSPSRSQLEIYSYLIFVHNFFSGQFPLKFFSHNCPPNFTSI